MATSDKKEVKKNPELPQSQQGVKCRYRTSFLVALEPNMFDSLTSAYNLRGWSAIPRHSSWAYACTLSITLPSCRSYCSPSATPAQLHSLFDMHLFSMSFYCNRLALSTVWLRDNSVDLPILPRLCDRAIEGSSSAVGFSTPQTEQTWVGNHKWKCTGRSVQSMTVVVQCALLILAFLPQTHACGREMASPTSKVVI